MLLQIQHYQEHKITYVQGNMLPHNNKLVSIAVAIFFAFNAHGLFCFSIEGPLKRDLGKCLLYN